MDMSNILLPDLRQMTENPDPCALFYFLYEACTRGASEIIRMYVSELGFSGVQRPSGGNFSSFEQWLPILTFEYFMIEAAAHGQQSVCNILIPHCKFNVHTM